MVIRTQNLFGVEDVGGAPDPAGDGAASAGDPAREDDKVKRLLRSSESLYS
jgi:hypothetical protein